MAGCTTSRPVRSTHWMPAAEASCRWSSIRALVPYRPRRSKPRDQNRGLIKKVTALAAVTGSVSSAFDAQIDLGHAAANGEHAVTRENRTARKQAPALPVRKPQFRLVQRVLSVNPAGDPVADKRRVDRVVEPRLRLGIFTDQRHGELRAVAVVQGNGLM